MHFSNRGLHLFCIQIFICLLYYGECCNFGPGNVGLGNIGVGNVGFMNFGFGNAGVGNRGVLNGGALNTGFSQLGLRNIGALNVLPIPNTVSVGNIPVGLNLSPLIRRRRRTMKYPEGEFPWHSGRSVKSNDHGKSVENSLGDNAEVLKLQKITELQVTA